MYLFLQYVYVCLIIKMLLSIKIKRDLVINKNNKVKQTLTIKESLYTFVLIIWHSNDLVYELINILVVVCHHGNVL